MNNNLIYLLPTLAARGMARARFLRRKLAGGKAEAANFSECSSLHLRKTFIRRSLWTMFLSYFILLVFLCKNKAFLEQLKYMLLYV
jgi:hypothetical protein